MAVIGCLVSYLIYGLGILAVIHLAFYVLPFFLMAVLPVPNLKKKYNAEWALVTGGSSGIGKALAEKLAGQGLNVVVVAIGDDLLSQTVQELKEKYPNQSFRSVGVMFSPNVNYMEPIIEATKDIKVQVIFNNAGYIVTGFFDQSPVEKHLANLECNATAAVRITHHYLSKLIRTQTRGCVVFTSSAAGYIPSPFSVLYGSTKAFLSEFAASLAVESTARGVDIVSIHPSPVSSRFYEGTHKLESLEMVLPLAVKPEQLPDEIFKSIGRCHLRDIGGFAVVARLAMAVLGLNGATTLFSLGAPFMGDFNKYNDQGKKEKTS